MWIPTLLLACLFFWAGLRVSKISFQPAGKVLLLIVDFLLGLPGLIFFIYYFKVLGEPLWLFRFRALPGTELAAAGVGFLIGYLQGVRKQVRVAKKIFSTASLPLLLLGMIMAPYLKPVIFPARWDEFADQWSDGVCLQSSSSSCGAACTATLLRFLGKPESERVIAREAHTSFTGTENWYLARVFRARGVKVKFVKETVQPVTLYYPAIAGVRLERAGHFIVILGREGQNFIIGDPLKGRELISENDLRNQYKFTGFFMTVK